MDLFYLWIPGIEKFMIACSDTICVSIFWPMTLLTLYKIENHILYINDEKYFLLPWLIIIGMFFEKHFATSFTIWHVFSAFWRSHSVMEWGLLRKSCLNFFFQNPFLWAMGQKNMNCGKIFLPYGITPLSLLKSPIFTMKKKLKYFFVNNKILRHIKLFCSIRHYMGILDMEFKRIFEATFFRVVFTPSRCGQ